MRTTIGFVYWPFEKKRSVARLAAQLVLGVVQVREVLDLGIGRKPLTAAPSARPRIDCSSSSVSNTRPAPACLEEALRDAVDAALRPTSSPKISVRGSPASTGPRARG
jgi:hypothetical protein